MFLQSASILQQRETGVNSAFFVTVQAGMAYRKIWRLDNNFLLA